jgi:hypothetical protein
VSYSELGIVVPGTRTGMIGTSFVATRLGVAQDVSRITKLEKTMYNFIDVLSCS